MYMGQTYSLASQKVGYSLFICMLIEVVVNVLCAHCTLMLMLTIHQEAARDIIDSQVRT